MGHIRLGRLPRSSKWRAVVALLDAGASVEEVASPASDAAKAALAQAGNDPVFLAIVELLVRLPAEARPRLDVPVHCPAIWSREDARPLLRETLEFLSDDHWHLDSQPREDDGPTQGIFDCGHETGFRPRRVVMFSGGLDSFAGALEEAVAGRERVASVSHSSATRIAKAQRQLVAGIRCHIPDGSMAVS